MTIKLISTTPTVSTSPAYTSGDSVGGKLTLTDALDVNGKGILRGVELIDQAKQNAAITVLFFSANPTNTTFTDNGALDVHDTDALTVIGSVNIAAANYVSLADNSVANVQDLHIPLEAASQTLYACMLTTGTPTYAATNDVTLKLSIEV